MKRRRFRIRRRMSGHSSDLRCGRFCRIRSPTGLNRPCRPLPAKALQHRRRVPKRRPCQSPVSLSRRQDAEEKQANDAAPPATEVASRDVRLAPRAPLPTKEEAERQIREEAAKLQADRVAQVQNRVATQHSHWMDEQIKFRDELAEVLRISRNQAGPDIDKLAKRL